MIRLPLFFALFIGVAHGATIVLPARVGIEETQAAADLSEIWLRGTADRAIVRSENDPLGQSLTGPWFFIGDTALARKRAPLPAGLDPDGFRVLTLPGDRVVIHGATAVASGLGVGWYAQHAMGVRWFVPGPLGEVVPALKDWAPPAMDRVVAPAFISRGINLGEDLKGGTGNSDWSRRNGLHEWLPHSHALAGYFPARLFSEHPDWFPLLEGLRHYPTGRGNDSWQPNLALPEVAKHVAEEANAYFDREPGAASLSLSINDSIRFDQSEATVKARGPLRWFRGRPDYSDVVFGFMNRVADAVALKHPDKLLSAYAYGWCENAPTFQVRPNIVPWLTADRSQGYDPAFRGEDRALIQRWCRSGARVVGIYDYLYGAPFLVPRMTTRMTAESIEFAHRAGIRAYYAEAVPNWAFDGPKLWVAAQLLWDPGQSVDGLLDEYYRGFWREAAPAMRRFDDRCEKAWESQPGPGWWLKYYWDDDQAGLFPPEVRAELRADFDEARLRARDTAVRARVERVSAGFEVTERFAEFCEARTALAKADGPHSSSPLLADFLRKRALVEPAYQRAVAAGAMGKIDLEVYLRDDPEWEMNPIASPGAGIADPEWRTLQAPGKRDDRTFIWSSKPWQGTGEPAEGRIIQVSSPSSLRSAAVRTPTTNSNTGSEGVTVTYRKCKADRLQQWVAAAPGELDAAEVHVRGKVSPGNETYLIMTWLDGDRRYVGKPVADRLPDGEWKAGKTLVVRGAAPAKAAYVGIGVFACNQTGDDYASFSDMEFQKQ